MFAAKNRFYENRGFNAWKNVRLDNYIYTVESFREAYARLAPEGFLYVTFFAEQPYIGSRLQRIRQHNAADRRYEQSIVLANGDQSFSVGLQ